MKKLNPNALGVALAFLFGICMLLVGALGMAGYYADGVEMMKSLHFFFDTTAVGVLLGIVEAAICGYIGGYFTGWVYNKFA